MKGFCSDWCQLSTASFVEWYRSTQGVTHCQCTFWLVALNWDWSLENSSFSLYLSQLKLKVSIWPNWWFELSLIHLKMSKFSNSFTITITQVTTVHVLNVASWKDRLSKIFLSLEKWLQPASALEVKLQVLRHLRKFGQVHELDGFHFLRNLREFLQDDYHLLSALTRTIVL